MEGAAAGSGGRRRILVVCYANICRSPIAAALLERSLQQAGLAARFSVGSAGVAALPGSPAASGARAAAKAVGIDLEAHRSRRLTKEMAQQADILIALDEVVEEEIVILAGDLPVRLWPVDDPYGGPAAGYERARHEIEAFVGSFVTELANGSAAP